MYAQALSDILSDLCTPAAVRAIEGGASAGRLHDALTESGFASLLVPEAAGGAGAGWGDFHAIAVLCGTHALPLPLAQTIAVRGMLADQAQLPDGAWAAFAPALVRTPAGELQAPLVPFGRVASHVIAADGDSLLLLACDQGRRTPTGIHGSLAATLQWDAGAATVLRGAAPGSRLASLAALLMAGLIAGAMTRAFELTMTYANERVQFGKSIGKFQAIQHQLSVMAEHVAAAAMAAQAAFHGAGADGLPTPQACAAAKARTSEAVQVAASIAHAVHGAIGITAEYDLQLYTRRMHEWRVAHGSEAYWHRELGRMALASDAPLFADFARSVL